MSYEHLRGVMAGTEHAAISPTLEPIARPRLTVVPDAPIAFEPEPLPPANPDEWQDRALCAQTDPESFFPEKGGSTREAKRVCGGCEVRAECLGYALEHDERFGIWGGLSERERRRLKRQAV